MLRFFAFLFTYKPIEIQNPFHVMKGVNIRRFVRINIIQNRKLSSRLGGQHAPFSPLLINDLSSSVQLVLNSSSGLINPTELPLNFVPSKIELGDINNDGKLDIVAFIKGLGSGGVTILYGDGSGGFSSPVIIPLVSIINVDNNFLTSPTELRVSDINNDGYSDLLILASSQGVLYVGLGGASGKFDWSQSISLGSFSVTGAIEIANLNSDNFSEIIIEFNGEILIINSSQGVAQIINKITFDSNGISSISRSLKIFDLNSDSNLDIYFSDLGNVGFMLLGDGFGNFSPFQNDPLVARSGQKYFEIIDLNGDNYIDLFVCTSNNPNYSAEILSGSINNVNFTEALPIGDFTSISVLDLNGDQLLDVVVSDNNLGTTSILYGTSDFYKEKISSYEYTISGEVGNVIPFDANGDEYQDFIVADRLAPIFYLNTGNTAGAYNQTSSFTNPFETGGIRSLDIGDLDNDGANDIVVGFASGLIYFYRNNGQGNFQLLQSGSVPITKQLNTNLKRLKVVDYNRDGHQDLIAFDDTSIYLMLGNSDFSFTTIISNTLAYNFINITGFEIKDLNGDKILDIILSDASLDVVALYSGNSIGDFRLVNTLSVAGVNGFAIGDYNKDALLDLVLAEPLTGLVLYRGNSLFEFFRDKTLYATDPYFFDGSDLNADGVEDFIFIDNTDLIKILLFDKSNSQVLEQISTLVTQGAPGGPGNMYFGDFGSIHGTIPDGNLDIFVGWKDGWIDGYKPILINQTFRKKILANGGLINELIRCTQADVSFELKTEGIQGFQWEYATDNVNFIPYPNQNTSVINYNLNLPLVYLRARYFNTEFCTFDNPLYSQAIKIQNSELAGFNPLLNLYSTCDTIINISVSKQFSGYQWSTGGETNTVKLRDGGFVSVKLTDMLNCTISDTAVVEITKLNIIQKDTTICLQTPITLHIDSLALKNNLYLNKLRNGLIFYAPMDSNTYDHMANFIHKTESGISYGSDRYGTQSRAVSFNGQSNNNVLYEYQSIIKQNAYTVAAWVKVTDGMFWVKAPRIGFLGTKDFIETFAENGIDAPGFITPDTWHHIATVWDSATSLHLLYIDGRQVRLGTGTSPEFLNTPEIAPIIIGSQSLPGDFIGSIDDVAIWSRILTPAEILQLYQDDLKVVWSNGSIGNSITVTPTASTKYYASYTIGSTTCLDSVQVNVSIVDTTVAFSGNLPKCYGDSITLIVSEGNAYKWYKNDTLISSANSNIYKVIDTGNYRVFISDSFGCIDSTSRITVSDVIVSSRFSINDTTQLLNGNNFVFKNLSTFSGTVGLTYKWDFGDGASSTEESPIHKYNQPGSYKVTLRAASSNGCIDSTSLDITVSPGLTALFNVNDSIQCLVGNLFLFRDSSVVIGDSVSYLWEFGDGGTSSVQHPSYSYNRSGIYNVKLVIIGSIGNTDSIYLRIRVDSMPQANFLVNDSLQCLSGNKYVFLNNTVVPIGDSYIFKWDFGDGDTSAVPSPVHTYKAAAKYNVSLVGKNNNGCSDTIFKMIHVFSQPKASFSVNDTTQPFGTNQFIFKNLSTVTDETPLRFEWDFGDGALSKEQSPIHTYDSVGVYRVRLLTFTEQDCVDSTFLSVSIFSDLKAGFIVNDSIQCLVGNLFEFTDTSKVDGGSLRYKWDFGDGINSANQHVVHSYDNPGLYIVKLLVTGSFGGIDSSFKLIKVNSMPDVGFRVNDTLQCLNGNSYSFLNTSVVPSGDTINYSWDFGDGITTDFSSPTHVYSKSGSYDVKLFGTNIFGCSDTSVVNIGILSAPKASFSINDSIQCLAGNLFIFTNTTHKNGNNLNYLWEFGDTKISREESPSHTFDKPGIYLVKLVTGNFEGCYDTVSRAINVFSNPVSKFTINDTLQCINNNLFRFIDSTKVPDGEKYSLNWNFGDGASSINLSPTHTYRLPGSYVVKMVSFVSEGCTDTFSVKVTVAPLPSFLKYDPVDVVSGIGMKLQARKIGEKYLWMPSTGLSSPFVSDPFVNLKNEQRYVIKITTKAKCDVYDTLLVRVFNRYDIFVPQGFTPNNDGKNDRLFPFLVGVKSLNFFKIYDRWGNLIYSNSNADRSNGWDGTFNGKLAIVGAYVWVAEGIDIDNNVIKRSGSFALIR